MDAIRWKLAIFRFVSVVLGLLLTDGLELGRVTVAQEETVLLQETGELAEGDHILEDGRFFDVSEFFGEAGQTVGITLESIAFNPVIGLFDDVSEVVAENDDIGAGNFHSFVKVVLPNNGTYRVVILPAELTGQAPGKGDYRLTVVADGSAKPVLSEAALKQVRANQLLLQATDQFRKSQLREALRDWVASLELYRDIGDRQGEAASLGNLGNTYRRLGQYDRAIDFHQQNLAITREIGDRQGEANSLGNLGNANHSLGLYDRAIDFHRQHLAIAREIGDDQGEANSLGNLGNAYRHLGQYDRAIDFHQQSLAITREIGDDQGEASSLGNLGNAYRHLGQYDRAIDFHQQHLVIARKIGDRQGKAVSLGNLGLAYRHLGQYERAIDFHQQSLAIAREIGDRQAEASSLGSLGLVYDSLGQHEWAIDFHQQSLAIKRDIGDRQGQTASFANLGVAHFSLGQYERALNFHQQSLAIQRDIGDRQGKASSLGNLGLVYDSLGQHEWAVDFHQQSLAIKRDIGDRQGEASSLGNLGNAHYSLGQYERASYFHQQSLEIAREIGDRQGEAKSLSNQGTTLISEEDYSEAESVLRQSIAVYESLRTELSDNQLISIADTQAATYNNLERALTAQNKTTDALTTTEQGRAQAFALQLKSRSSNIPADNLTTTPTFPEIQQIARDTNTTLVTYSLVFNQTLNIYIVQPNGNLQLRSVPLTDDTNPNLTASLITNLNGPLYRNTPPSKLTNLITDTRASVARVQGPTSTENLKDLHKLLIDPIADLLPADPTAKVAFIPDDNLFLVPFAALQDENGTHLIEKHTILTAPSIQVYGLANDAAATKPLGSKPSNPLIVGDPTMPTIPIATASGDFADTQLAPLPGAKAEAKAVGKTLNAQPLLGNQATEAQVKQQLPTAELIHLATHGLLQYGDPQAYGTLDFPGAIALAPSDGEDGLLTSAELLEMDLQASLAILSACDTGRGRITGDGVVGLSRSLITAGVPSVIVSLWAVPDAPTAELMTEFYQQLSQGQDKAQALRQAMLMTMKKHPNPRDWAAFTLMGSGN